MDPVRTEVMKNRFSAIAEEASTIAYRTAHTTFVKLTQDYQVALATLDGDYFAYPYQSGVTNFVGLSLKTAIDQIGVENMAEGDVIICNDPYGSGGMCTHTMDVHLLKPIFWNGVPFAFAWAFIHASDVGGAVPGSISPTSSDVFQEGIRMRAQPLYRAGELNQPLLDLFKDNCRIPEQIWGDLQAMLAAIGTMERRMQELCERMGLDDVTGSMEDVMAFAEMKAREAIGRIPDGEWTFGDYLEGVHRSDETIFLHCRMTVRGDELTLDFTGSDPQVPAALNFVTGDRSHPFTSLAILNYIQTVEPSAPMNNGLIRPIRNVAPKGTIMNCEFPAAMGNRWVSVIRVYDAVLGCLAQALGGGPVSAGAGQGGIIMASFRDETTGLQRIEVIQPLIGGSGGRCNADGVDAVDMPFAFLRSNPVESVEVQSPLVVRQFALDEGSVGAGRYRGGAAVAIDIEVRALEMVFTVRGLDRFVLRPWGVNGGRPGRIAEAILNPGTPAERSIGKITVLTLGRGDVLRLVTSSGGGYGDPLQRDAGQVLADVVSGLVTVDQARSEYGVVVAAGEVDAAGTQSLRERMANERGEPAPFDFGPERDDIERVWPYAMRARLAEEALGFSASLRHNLLESVRAERAEAGVRVDAAMLEESLERWRATLSGNATPQEAAE
jgi:N-methylhydantoinase B